MTTHTLIFLVVAVLVLVQMRLMRKAAGPGAVLLVDGRVATFRPPTGPCPGCHVGDRQLCTAACIYFDPMDWR